MSITVSRVDSTRTRHVVTVRGHAFTTDVQPADGGQDAGPDPHDLYDSALGACKALTMLWYAKRKAIPLESIDVAVERDASDETKGVYRLKTTLTLGGTLTDAQRQDLLRVASKCPIHKLMADVETRIETVLAG